MSDKQVDYEFASCVDEGFSNVFFSVVASSFPALKGSHLETCSVIHVFQAIDVFLIPSFVERTCDCCLAVIAEADGSDSEALWCRDCDMLLCPWCWTPQLEQRFSVATDTM